MLKVNNLVGFGGKKAVVGGGVNLTFLGYIGDNIDTQHYTKSNADLGTPSANRVIVVAAACSNSSQVTAMTIGGITATKAVGLNNGTIDSSVWYASVPTGTTGDIVTTSSKNRFSFTWYSINTSNPTPIDTAEVDDNSASNVSEVIDSSAGGAMVYALSTRSDEITNDPTWSGTSTPTSDQEMIFSSSTRHGRSGSMTVDSGDTVSGGTFGITGIDDTTAFAIASWQP